MAIAANRFAQVRAVVAHTPELVALARGHNDVNVLTLGARQLDIPTAVACLRAFCLTPFEGGRHTHRVELLDHLQQASAPRGMIDAAHLASSCPKSRDSLLDAKALG